MQNRPYQSPPLMLEKVVAALSYITCGFVGFFWLLLALFTKNNLKPYLKYHVFQSIFLAIAFFLVSQFLGLIMNILSVIPFLNLLMMQITFYLGMPLIFGFSIIQTLIYSVIIYLVVTSFQGQYSYIPWVSDIIRANVKNS